MKALAIVITLGVIAMAIRQSLPRGIRNNNPGNIRRNGIQWEGMKASQDDDEFVQFKSATYGFRAMARILKSYERRGLITVREIVSTYAPSTENPTENYINFVASTLNVSADQPLNLSNQLHALIKAITAFEQGTTFARFYSDSTITKGTFLA